MVSKVPALHKGDLVMFKRLHLSTLQANSCKLVRLWVGPVVVQAMMGQNKDLVSHWAGKLLPQVLEQYKLKLYHLQYVNLRNLSQELVLAMDEADAALKEQGKLIMNSVYSWISSPKQGHDAAATAPCTNQGPI